MLDLPMDIVKTTDDLSSHNLRTPLHHLLFYISALQDISKKMRLFAVNPEKKACGSQLIPGALHFKMVLTQINAQIKYLSRLEKDQDGKPLIAKFKTELEEFKAVISKLQTVRKSQLKLSNNFSKLGKGVIKKRLTTIVGQLDSGLKEAKQAVETLCQHVDIKIEIKDQEISTLSSSVLTSVRVLIVEDNKINKKMLAKYLQEDRKYECTFAENGLEAVTAFAPGKFDIVLMDIRMPKMDGYEATRQIRAKEKDQGGLPTPIIAVTAENAEKKAKEAGMDDFLPKPFTEKSIDDLFLKYLLKEAPSPVSTPVQSPAPAYFSLEDIKSAPLPSSPSPLQEAGLFASRSISAPELSLPEPVISKEMTRSPKSADFSYKNSSCGFFDKLATPALLSQSYCTASL